MSMYAVVVGVTGLAVSLKCFKSWMQGAECLSQRRLDGKTVVVTGANTGIGKECVRDFAKRGAKVVMLCRSLERAEAAAADVRGEDGEVVFKQLDLSSFKSIRACAEELRTNLDRIDILLNNAGVMACPPAKTEDGFEMQFGTNHLGHFLLTNLLLELLRKGGEGTRIVNVSSLAHERGKMNWSDLQYEKDKYEPWTVYEQSKLANVLFSSALAERVSKDGIRVYSLHPGLIATDLGRHLSDSYGSALGAFVNWIVMPLLRTPVSGAQTSIYCCVDESLDNETGRYYSDCREKLAAPAALVKEDAERLWKISEKLTGLN